jgi:hypothetical protein
VLKQKQGEHLLVSYQVEIMTPNGELIQGRMADVSDDGARIEVRSILGVPDKFHVKVKASEEVFAARVVWKKPRSVGIAFD